MLLHLARKAFYPGAAAVPAAARRHDVEVPRDDTRSATRTAQAARRSSCIVHINQDGLARGHRPVHARLDGAHRRDEDPGAEAGARQVRLRRGDRRRAARRGEVARQGAGLLASARRSTAGIRRTSARSCGSLYNARKRQRRDACACSRSPTGPSSTSGSTSTARTSRSCRCTSRAERPVVERDGALIMVDDERLPLRAGRDAASCARCASARSAAIRSPARSRATRDTLPEIIDEMLPATHLRAAGPRHRPRPAPRRWRRRSRRATSDGAVGDPSPTDARRRTSSARAKDLLRFITCGSVDDGKSTLIGRLLYESQAALRRPARGARGATRSGVGTQGGDLDFALLVDGLAAEREQGITIDVAYRFFTTRRGASSSSPTRRATSSTRATWPPARRPPTCAVILVDARKGVLTQTRRHSYIVSLLGIRHVVLAVNKMDLVDYVAASASRRSRRIPRRSRAGIGIERRHLHPAVGAERRQRRRALGRRRPGTRADAARATWRRSRSTQDACERAPFRLPVQWVNRPDHDFRGFAGTIASGTRRRGDGVRRAAVGPRAGVDAHRHRRRRPATPPSPARRSRSRWPTSSTSAAAT